ncbi:unnamed protein product, partial [Pylaiella littoralis]
MQRAPANGNQVGQAVTLDPSSPERLQHVGTMLGQRRPWPAFLHVGARATQEREACPTPVQEALAWMATSAVGLLDIASVGPLEPVCQAFKALIEAAEGAAASQDKLQSLVSRCAFLTTVFIQHDRAVGPLAQVRKPMKDFVATTNKLAAFAEKWAKGGKFRAFFHHRADKSTVTDFEEGLHSISNDIALVDGLEQRQLLLALDRRLRPPSLPDLAAVPQGAIELTDAHISRASLLGSAVSYLTNTALGDAPCVLAGMAGGGKSFLASAVVRDEKVVDALKLTGLQLLVTTRDRSVVSMPGECVEVGDMEEGEALEVLRVGCGAPKSLELPRSEVLQAPGATKTFAAHLVDQSMLQRVGDAFRVHDLVLHFLKLKLKADPSRPTATGRTVEHLGQLKVLQRFVGAGETSDGVYPLMGLWRSVENLAEESHVAAVYTKNLNGVTDSAPWQQAGRLLELMGKYDEAEPLYERSLAIREKALGCDHPDVAVSLNNRAGLLESQGKYDEADPLYLRAIKIGEKTLGPDHPDLATRLNNRAGLLESQGMYAEAEPLYERSQAIFEKVFGPEHPHMTSSLNNRAGLLESQGKYEEAGPLYDRSLAIREKALGPDHPAVATALNNRAGLLYEQEKYTEAIPLFERALLIRTDK